MKEVIAKLRFLKISPKKVRQVANVIKGMNFQEAAVQLRQLPQKSAKPLYKVLMSAAANAEHNFKMSRNDLYVSCIRVDPGPIYGKRWRARARGAAFPIRKRSSHVSIVLLEKKEKRALSKEFLPVELKKEDQNEKKVKTAAKTGKEQLQAKGWRGEKKATAPKTQTVKPKVFRRKAI